MNRNQLQLGFARQVVSCYLLVSLVAITWLSVGVVFAVHAVLSSRSESQCLTLMGKAAAQAQMAYLRDQGASFEALVKRIGDDNHLSYCGIVGTDGAFVAHTDPHKVGTKAPERTGDQMSWGQVEAIRYTTDDDHQMLELRTPLSVQAKPIGQLLVGSPAPEFWTTALAAAEVAPPAILIPLILVCAGALLLRRLILPIAQVQQQLRHMGSLPASMPLQLEKLPATSVVSIGWNRLIDQLKQTRQDATQQSLTERVAAAIEGRKQQESLHVLDHLSEGLAVTDTEGRITFANRALAALLGESGHGDEASGCPISDYLREHVDDPGSLEAVSSASPARATRGEVTRSHGERRRTLRIERQPIEAGRSGHVWSLRDITQQRLAEEMRGQFIDAATHELRTPLANIKAYSETLALMDDVDVEQQKEFCNTINNEATRLARFVDDLLSVSSMEVGSLSINRQNVQLRRMFDEVIDKVRPLTTQKSQEFGVDLPEKLGEAYLDKDKIAAMLVNLLGNASKYTSEQGRIGLVVSSTDGVLAVSVEDSGIGIAADELPHVFEKFFRSKDHRVQQETGTGLGLSLANEIVRLHGGELRVKSVVDKGSTFTVRIPLVQEARL